MAEAPIKFRCHRCDKLLGVSARKAGAVVNCPECGAPLQIPTPEPAAQTPRAGGSALPGDIAELRPEDIRVEPEFAGIVIDPAPMRPPPQSPETPPPEDAAKPPVDPPDEEETVLPNIHVEPPPLADHEPTGRASTEVVLPSTVVLAWSLLVLMAVPLAFLAGLLVGHFVWR